MGSFEGKDEKTTYELDGMHSGETEFVQAAEVEILGTELTDYRNNFDHAWTNKEKAYDDISEEGARFLNELKQFVNKLESEGLL